MSLLPFSRPPVLLVLILPVLLILPQVSQLDTITSCPGARLFLSNLLLPRSWFVIGIMTNQILTKKDQCPTVPLLLFSGCWSFLSICLVPVAMRNSNLSLQAVKCLFSSDLLSTRPWWIAGARPAQTTSIWVLVTGMIQAPLTTDLKDFAMYSPRLLLHLQAQKFWALPWPSPAIRARLCQGLANLSYTVLSLSMPSHYSWSLCLCHITLLIFMERPIMILKARHL